MADEAEATGDAVEEAEEQGAPEKRKGSHRLILFLLIGLVLAGGGAGAYWMGLIPGLSGGGHGGEGLAAEPADAHGAVEGLSLGPTLSFEPFIVNLADDDGGRYLKASMEVEFYGPEMPDAARALMPQIRDSLLTLLTSKSFGEIRTPEGKQELREEIIARLNQSLKGDVVKAVYFTEFIIQ